MQFTDNNNMSLYSQFCISILNFVKPNLQYSYQVFYLQDQYHLIIFYVLIEKFWFYRKNYLQFYVGFEVLTAVSTKMALFWVVGRIVW
jgi:hypothetical protein